MNRISLSNVASLQTLNREELSSVKGGNEYCASMYILRSCNTMTGAEELNWSTGWNNGGCNLLGSEGLHEDAEVIAPGLNSDPGCDFSWAGGAVTPQ